MHDTNTKTGELIIDDEDSGNYMSGLMPNVLFPPHRWTSKDGTAIHIRGELVRAGISLRNNVQ